MLSAPYRSEIVRRKTKKACTDGESVFASGFGPVFDGGSRVLILGSFPSVQSRKNGFYYGNPQNRFWKMLSAYFGERLPVETDEKRSLLIRRGIALWDVIESCRIEGSKDDSITEITPAHLETILDCAPIKLILLNGKKALSVFEENYSDCGVLYRVMPSTSPANPRYNARIWTEALDEVFRVDENYS